MKSLSKLNNLFHSLCSINIKVSYSRIAYTKKVSLDCNINTRRLMEILSDCTIGTLAKCLHFDIVREFSLSKQDNFTRISVFKYVHPLLFKKCLKVFFHPWFSSNLSDLTFHAILYHICRFILCYKWFSFFLSA